MIVIRPAQKTDFKIIYDFINLLENTIFPEDVQRDLFLKNLQNEHIIYLLAFEDDVSAGFISCHAQFLLHHAALIGEIQEMIVAENFRSKGVGKLLMHTLVELARSKNIVQLEVTSGKRRTEAHRFYVREGFAETHFKFTRALS